MYEKLLSQNFIEELMAIVSRSFPRDHYVEFAKKTQGVYARRAKTQKNKFNERVFELELSLIRASSANMSNRTISKVRTFLDDALLKKNINSPRWWVRAFSGVWKFFAVPVFRWVFGIISAFLVASLIAYFGLN